MGSRSRWGNSNNKGEGEEKRVKIPTIPKGNRGVARAESK